jgi:sirohydrochlorin ferrochelatase
MPPHNSNMKRLCPLIVALLWTCIAVATAQGPGPEGLLLLAHGGSPSWNQRVGALAGAVGSEQPTEVAFGMASRPAIQAAIDRLVARRVSRIVAVPLFVSSHSSVVRGTEYLLGLTSSRPADLAAFARMPHGAAGAGHDDHDAAASAEENMKPVASSVPIRMTGALDRHPLVGQILSSRAQSISSAPQTEAVILVAHGPNPEDDNARWLEDMAALASEVRKSAPYRSVDCVTLRDDAPLAVREKATADLRQLVTGHHEKGGRVLVVPLLMSFGGIEQGIRKRLEGLDYTMAAQGLMPDDRVALWVREMARRSRSRP